MDALWYLIGVVFGLYMVFGGLTKTQKKPYFWLHARAELLWRDKAHKFLAVSGLIITVLFAWLAIQALI